MVLKECSAARCVLLAAATATVQCLTWVPQGSGLSTWRCCSWTQAWLVLLLGLVLLLLQPPAVPALLLVQH